MNKLEKQLLERLESDYDFMRICPLSTWVNKNGKLKNKELCRREKNKPKKQDKQTKQDKNLMNNENDV